MGIIKSVFGREILDSRGRPTVECEVLLSSGAKGRASVPSGVSVGKAEAVEIRDFDKRRYVGMGVLKAVNNINQEIGPAILGFRAVEQIFLDRFLLQLDGTESKSRLGANAILPVSLAVAKAAAHEVGLAFYSYIGGVNVCRLPVPMINIINGGSHANNGLDLQEFMILPVGFDSFKEAVRSASEVFHELKKLLLSRNMSIAVGDEGGFSPNLDSHEMAMDLIMDAIALAGYVPGKDVVLALDCAASHFYRLGDYCMNVGSSSLKSKDLIELIVKWCNQYPIVSVEDGLAENDWEGWKELTKVLGKKIQLVGDDIFVTNTKFLTKGIEEKVANAILIKPNQVGTLTEALETINMAIKNGYCFVISHRSGETEDTWISDMAVAMGATQVKMGSLCRSERTAKYNQILRIEECLGKNARYAGKEFFDFL